MKVAFALPLLSSAAVKRTVALGRTNPSASDVMELSVRFLAPLQPGLSS